MRWTSARKEWAERSSETGAAMAMNLLRFISRSHDARSRSVVYGDGDIDRTAGKAALVSDLEAERSSEAEHNRGGTRTAIRVGGSLHATS